LTLPPSSIRILSIKEHAMAGGWTRDGNIQDQIDASVEDEVACARSRLAGGESLTHCEECGEPIPERRRQAVAGVRRCVICQAGLETQSAGAAGFNRRGNKDSQLK